MIERLDAFEQKTLSLGDLVSNLDGLQNALRDVDAKWRNAFLKQWGVLEDVYADSLDKRLIDLPAEWMTLIKKAIEEMRWLISKRL